MAVKAAGRRNVPKLLLPTPVYAVLWFIPLSSWVFRERPESEKRKPQGNNKDNNNKRQDKVAQREEREREREEANAQQEKSPALHKSKTNRRQETVGRDSRKTIQQSVERLSTSRRLVGAATRVSSSSATTTNEKSSTFGWETNSQLTAPVVCRISRV